MANAENPQFPLNNAAYNVISIIHHKSKAIDAYSRYIDDVQADTSLRQAIISMRHDEQRHIETLKAHLVRLLA
jgi:hypothetical protein